MGNLNFVHDAPSIHVSTGREGPRKSDLPPQPMIVINYPYDFAQELVVKVLKPHAKPEHCFVGYYRHADGNMTLGCYLVVPVPYGPTYVLGNERNMDEDEWAVLHERIDEFGSFMVSCGIETGDESGNYLTKPMWFLEMRTLHRENILPMITKAALE